MFDEMPQREQMYIYLYVFVSNTTVLVFTHIMSLNLVTISKLRGLEVDQQVLIILLKFDQSQINNYSRTSYL